MTAVRIRSILESRDKLGRYNTAHILYTTDTHLISLY
jgi:hypothetical protein